MQFQLGHLELFFIELVKFLVRNKGEREGTDPQLHVRRQAANVIRAAASFPYFLA